MLNWVKARIASRDDVGMVKIGRVDVVSGRSGENKVKSALDGFE